MKTLKTTLAVITAALLALALLASPSSAAIGVDDKPDFRLSQSLERCLRLSHQPAADLVRDGQRRQAAGELLNGGVAR